MHRIAVALAVALMIPVVTAGSADAPEWSDPSGDVEVTGGGPATSFVSDDGFEDVDLIAAWIELADNETVRVLVRSTEPVSASANTTIRLTAAATGSSIRAPDAADPAPIAIYLDGDAVATAPEGVVSATSGPDLAVTLPIGVLGALPGDEIQLLEIGRHRSTSGSAPVLDAGQTGSDAMDGTAAAFALPRPSPVVDVQVALTAGTITDSAGTREFTTLPVATQDPRAVLDLSWSITNLGTDHDIVSVSGDATTGGVLSLHASGGPLAPGDSLVVNGSVRLAEATGPVTVTVDVTSERGAATQYVSALVVDAAPGTSPVALQPEQGAPLQTPQPPEEPERAPKPAGLHWLTPVAEPLGAVAVFGEYGELVVLAVLIAIFVAVTFLALAMARPSRTPLEPPEPEEEPIMEAVSMQQVRQQVIPGKPTIVLDAMDHSSDAPQPGERVTSSIVIENTGELGARLRAVLYVNGAALGEKVAAAPSHQRVKFTFPWKAGSSGNDVVIRVYPA